MSTSRTNSDKLFQKACLVMPGGVSSPVRAFRSVGGTPVFFRRASGARFWDEDGNEYLDFCMSWGPLILGHAHPAVTEAVQRAARDGLSYGACCAREGELAELVLDAFPRMEQVRFTSSGTEAVMTAIRLARGYTGRTKIVKFDGGYHGHSDSLLVKAGSGLATFGTSSSQGVPESLAAETLVLPFDDETLLEQTFRQWGDSIAAVIVEPLPANNGLLEQRPQWLRRLRELTSQHGALLIFDEVISGFRLRYGGYGDSLDIPADLITLGKILGGGMPAAAVIGPRRIMSSLAPLGGVYQAGTLSGNPVALSAGIATLGILKEGTIYAAMERTGQHMEAGLQEWKSRTSVMNWRRIGSIFWPYFADGPVPRTTAAISQDAVRRFNRIHPRLLDHGLYLPPSAYEVLFLSAAHTESDVTRLVNTLAVEISRPEE